LPVVSSGESEPPTPPVLQTTPLPANPSPPSERRPVPPQTNENAQIWDEAPKCSRLEPGYTDEARRAHIQGQIILDVTIQKNSTVSAAKVITGLGYGLDENAIATVQNWVCTPAAKDGKPIDATVRVTLNFRLY